MASPSATASDRQPAPTTLLIGNPNVGKSVIFGVLTGRYATVSNYPGTTVEITSGARKAGKGTVLDLPGTNSLLPSSEDEQVTRDILLELLPRDGVRFVQVCDAKNLRRGITIALELAELEAPMLLVANMLDEAASRGVELDCDALADASGVEVLGSVATRRQGLGPLAADTATFRKSHLCVRYSDIIEEGIREVAALLPAELPGKRGVALMLLAGDRSLAPWATETLGDIYAAVQKIQSDVARRTPEPLRFVINRARLAAADAVVAKVLTRRRASQLDLVRRFGTVAMHPIWGVPIAVAVLYVTYLFVGVLGAGAAVDFLESTLFAGFVTPWADTALRFYLSGFPEELLVGPPGVEPGTGPGLLIGDYGLISMALSYSVAIVLPIVGFFFVAFSIMEDSGYLPRLAVMLNRAFKVIGLNGKAVLPMILGLGCDTMATMTARVLPTPKERVLVTLLLALGVPCSAQLGVILGMLAGLSLAGTLWWLGAVIGVMLAVGFIANKVLPGRGADFVLEIPPMRRPQLGNILIKTLARIEWYLKEAVPLFILGTFVLWVLDRLALLDSIERVAAPVVQGLLGLPAAATEAFLIGFLRRDYGAAGLYALFNEQLSAGTVSAATEIQVVVSMVTITLFVPCIANVFMIAKERGLKTAIWMTAFIFPFAFVAGGLLNQLMRAVML
jgi:ferrous iron transport protein B